MISKVHNIKTRMVCLLTASIISIPALALATESRGYPKTIGVLVELYAKGLATWHHLKAYELQAKNENLDEMAKLFAAMAASQSVITDHFHLLLADLGGAQPMCLVYPRTVGVTKDNLRSAIEMELLETDVIFSQRAITNHQRRIQQGESISSNRN